jgi:hypothetical protein
MIIQFRHEFSLPVEAVYSYFHTPADWVRLYGLAGAVKDLGEGWYAVPLKRFPFPLVAKNTEQTPNELVRWIFRGFWRGRGEVRFTERPGGMVPPAGPPDMMSAPRCNQRTRLEWQGQWKPRSASKMRHSGEFSTRSMPASSPTSARCLSHSAVFLPNFCST